MNRQCPACRYPIEPEQHTLMITHTGVSDLIHYGCVFRFFDPSYDDRIYEIMYEKLEEQIRTEVRDTEYQYLWDHAWTSANQNVGVLCVECQNDIEEVKERIERDKD